MKVLHIYGDDDFAVIEFENTFKGRTIQSIISQYFDNDEELPKTENEFYIDLLEFGEIDDGFARWIKNQICDYDQLKNESFYLETDII